MALKFKPLFPGNFAYTALWRQIPVHNLNVAGLLDGPVNGVDQHLAFL